MRYASIALVRGDKLWSVFQSGRGALLVAAAEKVEFHRSEPEPLSNGLRAFSKEGSVMSRGSMVRGRESQFCWNKGIIGGCMFAKGFLYCCSPTALRASSMFRYARPDSVGLEVGGYVNRFDKKSGRSLDASRPSGASILSKNQSSN